MQHIYPTIPVVLDDGAYMPERAHDTDAGYGSTGRFHEGGDA